MSKKMAFILQLTSIAIVILFVASGLCADKSDDTDDMSMALRMALYKAQQSFEKNDFQGGLQILSEYRASGTDDASYYLIDFWSGNARLQMGQLDKAADDYAATVAKKPDFSAAHLNLAKCLYDLNRYEKAAKAFTDGYETSEEKNPEILYYAAACYISADKSSKAIPILERLVALNTPKARAEWKETLVHAYLADNQPKKALPLMEQLVKIFTGEKKMQWLESLLYQYLSLDMKKKALELADKLTADHPEEPKWWKTLAHIHLSSNQERKALVALTIYGYLTPLSDKEQKLLADLNLMLGVPKKAASFYEDLLATSGSSDLVEKIVQCHQMAGQLEKAMEWVDRGLAKYQTHDLMMMKGNILYEMKRYGLAVSAFEAAAGMNGKDPGRPWLMIGYSAWLNDDLKKAKNAFQKAAGYERHKKDAFANIERIDKLLRSKS